MTGAPVFTLWSTEDATQHFLMPNEARLCPGSLPLRNRLGLRVSVRPSDVKPFEITERQARRWARKDLGEALDALQCRLGEGWRALWEELDVHQQQPSGAASPTTDATSALLRLVEALPQVILHGLSESEERVAEASAIMSTLHVELEEAGIPLDSRFTGFPERLAELRRSVKQSGRS